jgi:hypothetical protein
LLRRHFRAHHQIFGASRGFSAPQNKHDDVVEPNATTRRLLQGSQ